MMRCYLPARTRGLGRLGGIVGSFLQMILDRKWSPFAVGDHLRYCTVRKNSKQKEANEYKQVLTYQVFYRHLRILGDH